ncbi:hypothetical protein ACNFR7_15600 [Streptomyces sp. RM1]
MPRALIERFKRDGAAAGSYNVGGPVLSAGGGPGLFLRHATRHVFRDATRHGHVHLGFRV